MPGSVLTRRLSATMPHARRQRPAVSVRTIYDEHAGFVWLTLQRLGVRPADLDDLAQDVFVIVHRRRDTFDGTSRMTTWLFGICKRVAANYRRRRGRAPFKGTIGTRAREQPTVQAAADEMLMRREDRAIAEQIVASLSLEKRAVFTMFEIEGFTCQEIADVIGIPIGTVYSRLHAARTQIEGILSRMFSATSETERGK
jgi:RNA polymerase sigma-70 factor (ECF subfamily)